jgi:hypothetical protein
MVSGVVSFGKSKENRTELKWTDWVFFSGAKLILMRMEAGVGNDEMKYVSQNLTYAELRFQLADI